MNPGLTITAPLFHFPVPMSFAARLIALRKEKGLTQQALAEACGIHVQQIKRYEAGSSQPTAEALKKLALTLHVSVDSLLFEEGERGPDEELRLQFEALSAMPPEEKAVARAVLDAIIVKNQVAGALERFSTPAATKAKKAARERAKA
jgi:transcriptional regulator with XRE-family HTH domain